MPSVPIVIKRYGRARLYDPARQRYVTLQHLRNWQRSGVAFVMLDTETGADITRVLRA